MSPETIVIAADHAGYEMKRALKQRLADDGFDVVDLGTACAAAASACRSPPTGFPESAPLW
jgi:ribose 5-phosphate isomerase RpiB